MFSLVFNLLKKKKCALGAGGSVESSILGIPPPLFYCLPPPQSGGQYLQVQDVHLSLMIDINENSYKGCLSQHLVQ